MNCPVERQRDLMSITIDSSSRLLAANLFDLQTQLQSLGIQVLHIRCLAQASSTSTDTPDFMSSSFDRPQS